MPTKFPFQKVTKHKFVNTMYRVLWKEPKDKPKPEKDDVELFGLCAPPDSALKDRFIYIRPDKGVTFLDTSIHESLHACQWYLDEEAVTKIATSLAKFLWRTGYRLTDGRGSLLDVPSPSASPKAKAKLRRARKRPLGTKRQKRLV